MNGGMPTEGDIGRNRRAEAAQGESDGTKFFLQEGGRSGEERERVFETERCGFMGVRVKGDADGVFACESAEASEGFAEPVGITERVFEEGELVGVREGVLDEE